MQLLFSISPYCDNIPSDQVLLEIFYEFWVAYEWLLSWYIEL